MTINNLEIEIKKYDRGYSFSSEENGKKKIYTIYSPELRQRVREIISPYGIVGKGNIQYEGKNSHGDCILYQQGKDDLSDQITLIRREIVEKKKELKEVDEWDKADAEFKAIEDKWKKEDAEWKKRENELGIPTNYIEKHLWRGWNNDGTIGMEGIYIKSENQSQIITLENKGNNLPLIQAITDKETEQINGKTSPTSDKKDQPTEIETNQPDFSQKIDNQENLAQKSSSKNGDNKVNNSKSIYYGVGAIFLVLVATSLWVGLVKKKRKLK